ncbi:MAG: signal transduction histidine kinase [Candidatus Latescibacterota bacterium]|jgi:signal transduction histidine kinase
MTIPTKTSLELNLQDRLRRLNEIGVALSAERDLHELLRLILLESRLFTRADAGTLYLVGDDILTFEITQNDTFGKDDTHWEKESQIPPVPLDKKSASGYAALTGKILNIADVYSEKKHAFEGPKKYDQLSGYRTQSMLVVPMKNHDEQVIAILQLLNATDADTGAVMPFSHEEEVLVQSLASQAAVAINNVRLIEETQRIYALERQLLQAERMASVGLVAAGIVHNLRNPLMIILGYSELIQTKQPDLAYVEEIIRAGKQMTQMVEDILAKSRQRKTPEAVDLNVLLKRELEFMQADATFKNNVEKDVLLADELPPFQCVYTDFSQAIGNLLRNALDAMHQSKEKQLTVKSDHTDGQITIDIGDTGSGIAAEEIPHLFKPFFTTKNSEAKGDEPMGTGLGLYMLHRLLEPYGVDVQVESEVGVGTTFRLCIPLTPPTSTDAATPPVA